MARDLREMFLIDATRAVRDNVNTSGKTHQKGRNSPEKRALPGRKSAMSQKKNLSTQRRSYRGGQQLQKTIVVTRHSKKLSEAGVDRGLRRPIFANSPFDVQQAHSFIPQ